MPEVVELRVHGVGGGSPESLLGVAAHETIRVAGEGPTGFWARRSQRSVEGYWWGRLTSAAMLQPLWIVLLPFTMLNLAGWMHQPAVDRARPARPWWAVRGALWLLGYLLTMVYAAWSGMLLIDLALLQWWLNGRLTHRALGFASAVALVGFGVLYGVARHVQRGFEGKQPPRRIVRESVDADDVDDHLAQARRFGGERELAAPSFWAHQRGAGLLLGSHSIVALLVWMVPVAVAAPRLGSGTSATATAVGYEAMVSWLLRATMLTLVVLFVLTTLERRGVDRASGHAARNAIPPIHSGFRFCGQAVAATFGVALAVGAFSGFERLLRRRIPAAGAPYQALDVAFGIAALVFVGMLVWRAATHTMAKRRIVTDLLPAARGTEGHVEDARPRQVSSTMRHREAWGRSLSEALRNIDLVLSVPALCFLLAAAPATIGLAVAHPALLRIADLGGSIILLGVSGILPFLWWEGRRSATRRRVGMLWDVLTFWPRRIHPWGIRPYAERAVPELQHRLCRHLRRGRRVILSAHSQGTVIAVAALAQFMAIDPTVLQRVALVTYGSPIVQLYARFFPAYFHGSLLADVHTHLFDDGLTPHAGWRNFYRETDYVGKALFVDVLSIDADQLLDDPATQPDVDDLPFTEVLASAPDPVREAFTTIAGHSDYNGELELRTWVEALAERLRRADGRTTALATDDLPSLVSHGAH
ncbi:MAG: hypothetical protein KY460_12790 [Actinobacteria bacterium]|nr:hypothetical protein [Actinomycetota bacterium]